VAAVSCHRGDEAKEACSRSAGSRAGPGVGGRLRAPFFAERAEQLLAVVRLPNS
jgi:hypothetical protein